MSDPSVGNYLRAHRRKAGLSQHEVGQLVGYRKAWQVSRHEKSKTVPPLLIALQYEVLFRIPISALFTGFHGLAMHAVERSIAEFEEHLREKGGNRRSSNGAARKLQWLAARKH